MNILFVINNRDECYMHYAETGVWNAPKRRAVEIELTPEQVKKIGIRKIDFYNGRDIFETIESISLTD